MTQRIFTLVIWTLVTPVSDSRAQESLLDHVRILHGSWENFFSADVESQEEMAQSLLQRTSSCMEAFYEEEGEASAQTVEMLLGLVSNIYYCPVEIWESFEETREDVESWSRELAESLGPSHESMVDYELINWQLQLRELTEAQEAIEDARDRWDDDPKFVILQIDLHRLSGEWEDAYDLLKEAQEAIEASDAPTARADALQLRLTSSLVYQQLGLVDLAESCLEELTDLPNDETHRPYREAALVARADLLLLCNRNARVRDLHESYGPELSPEHRTALQVRAAIAGAADALKNTYPIEMAIDRLAAALNLDGIGLYARSMGLLRLAELHYLNGDVERVSELLGTHKELTADWDHSTAARDLAYHAALDARLSLDVDQRQAWTQKRDNLRERYTSLVDQWRSAPLREGGLGFLQKSYRRGILDTLMRIELALDGPQVALDALLETQTLGTFARRHGIQAPSPDEVEQTLANGSGLLIYSFGPSGGHLFLWDRQGLDHYPLPLSSPLAEVLEDARSILSSPPGEGVDWQRSTTRLQSLLFPKDSLDRIASWTSIQVSGDARLRGLLEPCSVGAEKPLALTHAISYLPSVPVGLHLGKRAELSKGGDRRLGLAWIGPEILKDPSSLDMETLLDGILRQDRRVVFAPQNVGDVVQSIDWERTAFAHFFCHGRFEKSRERFAGLLAGNDQDILWAEDLETLPLPPLVILSACGAAQAPSRLGEDGVSHLGGAALQGGASAVLLSHETLDAQATAALTSTVSRELAAGHPPAEALRRARVELAADDRYDHPYYYANLWLFGYSEGPLPLESAPPVEKDRPAVPWFILVCGAVLFVLGLRALRQR